MRAEENRKQFEAEFEQATNTARALNARWENEPDQVAFEMAQAKLDKLEEFIFGYSDSFNAYYVTEEPCHRLMNKHFIDGLQKISVEYGLEPVELENLGPEPISVLDTGFALLQISCTTYENGEISGMLYRGITRPERELFSYEPSVALGSTAVHATVNA